MEVGKRDLVACFNEFGGHKGYLDAEDLHVALAAVLPTPPFTFEVARIAEAAGGRVSFDGFAAAVKAQSAAEDPRVWVRLAFREFDQKHQGYLEFSDLQQAVESIGGAAISESALRTVFAEADTDADGKVTFDEFAWIVHAAKLRAPGRSAPSPAPHGGSGGNRGAGALAAGAGSSVVAPRCSAAGGGVTRDQSDTGAGAVASDGKPDDSEGGTPEDEPEVPVAAAAPAPADPADPGPEAALAATVD